MRIMPAFHRFPNEAAMIGRLLAGYGELEFDMCEVVGVVLRDPTLAFRAVFRMRQESQRIDLMDSFLHKAVEKYGLSGPYGHALGAIRYCRTIRNQFAHSHWIDFKTEGLFFTNLEDAARSNKGGEPLAHFRHVDVQLLQSHEAYYSYAQDCLLFLQHTIRAKDAEAIGGSYHHPWTEPKAQAQPPLHNPPELHPLPPLGIREGDVK